MFGKNKRKVEGGGDIKPRWRKIERRGRHFTFMLFGTKERKESKNPSSCSIRDGKERKEKNVVE